MVNEKQQLITRHTTIRVCEDCASKMLARVNNQFMFFDTTRFCAACCERDVDQTIATIHIGNYSFHEDNTIEATILEVEYDEEA